VAKLPDPAELVNKIPHQTQPMKVDLAPPEIQDYIRKYCRLWAAKLRSHEQTAASWYQLRDALKGHYEVSRPTLARWVAKRMPKESAIISGGRYG
jgi:hypothetical protein